VDPDRVITVETIMLNKRYDVQVTIDRGSSPNQINYARFIKAKANPWPLTLNDAMELVEQERQKPYVMSAKLVEV
jgi:hypothetical protein